MVNMEPEETFDYNYRPLKQEPPEIRLLYFEPDSHCTNETRVRCRLEHVSLRDARNHNYIAMSYSWGKDKSRTEVDLNGQCVKFLTPAERALRGAFSRSLAFPQLDLSAPVWIDQICINQTDDDEKSVQVELMMEVYSYAKRVHVWLGPHTELTSDAVRSINVMHGECHRVTEGFKNLIRLSQAVPNDGKGAPASFPSACNLMALVEFYTADWFTRIWPVQEVIMAKEAIMIQGDYAIPWERVAVVGRWMVGRFQVFSSKIKENEPLRQLLQEGGGQGLRNAGLTWDMKFDVNSKGRRPRDVFYNSRSFDSSDPRDKIWAFFGLLKSFKVPESHLRIIKPDYANKKTVSEVYAAATFMIFLNDRNVSYLEVVRPWQSLTPPPPEFASKGVTVGACPSWAIKFEKLKSQEEIQQNSLEFYSFRIHGVFAGSKISEMTINAKLKQAPHVLTVKGIVFTTVKSVGKTIDPTLLARSFTEKDLTAVAKELVSSWRPGELDPSFIWPAETLRQFGTAAVNGMAGLPSDAHHVAFDTKFPGHWAAFLLRCMECLGPVDPRLRSLVQGWAPAAGNARGYHTWMIYFGSGKVVYTTSAGYLGAGPAAMQPGDKVCFVFGCKVPLILRRKEENWQIVGQSYVCKVMNVSAPKGRLMRDTGR